MNTADDQDPTLITALMQAEAYKHPVEHIQLVETHISWVILTGPYAYKIKKPMDLGFVDFSSLEKRRYYCGEEIRLNRRLAPQIYLDVVPISCPQGITRIDVGEENAIEYAVKMTQFPTDAQLDRILNTGELEPSLLDAFARLIATFHQKTDRVSKQSDYGDKEHLSRPVFENFYQIRKHTGDASALSNLDLLEKRAREDIQRLGPTFEYRKAEGYIRECHGDLHLRNMAWVNDKPLVFDCIEFDPNLRWIDVISEVAFLVMDLEKRSQSQLAYRFLNAYLERTGDYSGLRVLNFYLIYRTLVRAKVEAIRTMQAHIGPQDKAAAEQAFQEHLQLAVKYTQTRPLQLIVTRGLSGSGKTTLTQQLIERLGAVRIRSDVERKRLFGLNAEDDGKKESEQDIYSAKANQQTYHKLADSAEHVLDSGYPVIIDAACLKEEQRALFRNLASAKKLAYTILDITASKSTLRHRIENRRKGVSDADVTVLEYQITVAQKLGPDELPHAISVDTELPLDMDNLVRQIEERGKMQRFSLTNRKTHLGHTE